MSLQQKNYDPAIMYGATDTAPSQITLTNTNILVGDGTGNAADVALSGDATMANTGAMTIAASAVTPSKTGFVVVPSAAVSAQAATGNLAAGDMGKNITNTGAGGAIVLTLLAAATAGVTKFRIYVTVAQDVTLTPQAGEKIYLAGSGVASKYLLIKGVIGNYCDVYCNGTDYFVTGWSGVVTKEA